MSRPKRSSLPAIVSSIAPDLRRFLNRIKELFDSPTGVVTKEDLVNTGAFTSNLAGQLYFPPPVVVSSTTCVTPPAPTNLSASGAMTSVILTWSGVDYGDCYAYTELWRADNDDIGEAVLIGTTQGATFADAVGSEDSNYYWVRFVDITDNNGPYNTTSGVLGATAPDLAYVFSQLADTYSSTSDAPFFQLDSAEVINGVTIAAGTYVRKALIYDGVITNAKIGTAAVDTAKIANAAITNAKILNLDAIKITTGYLSSNRIDADTITASQIVLSGIGALTAGDIGANRTYQSSSYPSTDIVEGDLWINTGDNNTVWVYDGTAPYNNSGWVSHTMDAAQAINDGTTTISGGKITSLSIDTLQLAADAVKVSKLDIDGPLTINSTSGNEGSFSFHKTAYNDYNTSGVFIGNRTTAGTATFLAGNSTSYLVADEAGILIVRPEIFGLVTLTSAPLIPGETVIYPPGSYRFDFFPGQTSVFIEWSGGGGGGGHGYNFGTGPNGTDGGDSDVKLYKSDGTLVIDYPTSSGGNGGEGNSLHTADPGDSFNPLNDSNSLFYGVGGTATNNNSGGNASGKSAGGGGGSDDTGPGSEEGAGGGAGGYNSVNYTITNNSYYLIIYVGAKGVGTTQSAGETGGNGVDGVARIKVI